MEQYEYAEAVKAFRKVRELRPGLDPGSINLAIALLNDTGVKTEAAKKTEGEPEPSPATSTRPSSCSPACWPASPKTCTPTTAAASSSRSRSVSRGSSPFPARSPSATRGTPPRGTSWPSTISDENPAKPDARKQAKAQIELLSEGARE